MSDREVWKRIKAEEPANHTEHDLDMVGMRCLADIRFAVGDRGQMTQPELVECIKRLRADAERYRWLRGDSCPDHSSIRWARWEVRCYVPPVWSHDLRGEKLDAAIDAAMAKEARE